MKDDKTSYDVAVVGHGISGLSAALAAKQADAESVVVIEKSPKAERGGHTRFTNGVLRFPIEDPERVREELDLDTTPPRYTRDAFLNDIYRASNDRSNDELCEKLAEEAYSAVKWLTELGLEWQEVKGTGVASHLAKGDEYGGSSGSLRVDGKGQEIVDTLSERAEELGVEFRYDTEVREFITDSDNSVSGFTAVNENGRTEYAAKSTVLCVGSYVSNAEKRARYFGPDGEAYVVRGSKYNTGEGLDAALDVGAMPTGQWDGAHSVMVDINTPESQGGAAKIKGYQYGIVLNKDGERFLDEGEDSLLKTYAKFGNATHQQRDHVAFIVFDSKTDDLIISEMESEPVKADTLEELIEILDIENESRARETIAEFNAAATDVEFDPDRKDGKRTVDISPAKSNWATPIDTPPFRCFPVTSGITFAYGGLKIDTQSKVLGTNFQEIPGLWAAGNSTGEFFYNNYPGGVALTRGATFGRISGAAAARFARDT